MNSNDYNGNPTTLEAIVRTVAAEEGIEPTELEPPLYEAIDPDALQSLLDSSDAVRTVQFSYGGRTVEVRGDGQVTVLDDSG